eukprot:GHVQ01017265.1.p1 GENE.GHVQ01017265.1~~GHVQ01017265.1.p1  ORF type:complete len:539 (+),score=60.11 GHVQ01017265.1:158-1618(+)
MTSEFLIFCLNSPCRIPSQEKLNDRSQSFPGHNCLWPWHPTFHGASSLTDNRRYRSLCAETFRTALWLLDVENRHGHFHVGSDTIIEKDASASPGPQVFDGLFRAIDATSNKLCILLQLSRLCPSLVVYWMYANIHLTAPNPLLPPEKEENLHRRGTSEDADHLINNAGIIMSSLTWQLVELIQSAASIILFSDPGSPLQLLWTNCCSCLGASIAVDGTVFPSTAQRLLELARKLHGTGDQTESVGGLAAAVERATVIYETIASASRTWLCLRRALEHHRPDMQTDLLQRHTRAIESKTTQLGRQSAEILVALALVTGHAEHSSGHAGPAFRNSGAAGYAVDKQALMREIVSYGLQEAAVFVPCYLELISAFSQQGRETVYNRQDIDQAHGKSEGACASGFSASVYDRILFDVYTESSTCNILISVIDCSKDSVASFLIHPDFCRCVMPLLLGCLGTFFQARSQRTISTSGRSVKTPTPQGGDGGV